MNRLLIPNTTQVPNVLLDRLMAELKNTSLRVILAVVRLTYGFQKQADKISITQLQKITGLSRQGVVTGVAALGPLLKVKPGVKGRGANEYSLSLDVSTGQLVNHFDQSTILTSQKRTAKVVNVVDSSKPIYSKPNTPGTKVPASSPSRKGIKLTRRVERDPATLAAFDAFYDAYPRHVARQAALTAWVRLNPNPELQGAIMAAVARYAKENESTEQRYIPHPATWLNGRRWEDGQGGAGNGNGQKDGPPKILKRDGDTLTLGDGSIMLQGTYERRYGVRI